MQGPHRCPRFQIRQQHKHVQTRVTVSPCRIQETARLSHLHDDFKSGVACFIMQHGVAEDQAVAFAQQLPYGCVSAATMADNTLAVQDIFGLSHEEVTQLTLCLSRCAPAVRWQCWIAFHHSPNKARCPELSGPALCFHGLTICQLVLDYSHMMLSIVQAALLWEQIAAPPKQPRGEFMLCTEEPARLRQRLLSWARAAQARGTHPHTVGAQIVQLLRGLKELGMLGEASDPLLQYETHLQAQQRLREWEEKPELKAFDDS